MTHISKIVALTLSITLAAQIAHADTPQAQVSVSYGDLDLNKRAGAEAMLSRLEAGVDQVCGKPGHLTLAQRQQYRTCSKQAMNAAVTELGAPMVSALYGQPLPRIALGE